MLISEGFLTRTFIKSLPSDWHSQVEHVSESLSSQHKHLFVSQGGQACGRVASRRVGHVDSENDTMASTAPRGKYCEVCAPGEKCSLKHLVTYRNNFVSRKHIYSAVEPRVSQSFVDFHGIWSTCVLRDILFTDSLVRPNTLLYLNISYLSDSSLCAIWY